MMCTISGCDRTYYGNGMCNAHWQRARKHGDPLHGGPLPPKREKTCSVNSCTKHARTFGLCDAHRSRFNRYGDPTAGRVPDGTPLEWLNQTLKACRASEVDECIDWPFATAGAYGWVQIEGVGMGAHRAALALWTDSDGAGMEACHAPGKCHRPICVNPSHLRWGSSSDNTADMWDDRTMFHGEEAPWSILTEKNVLAIRTERPRGKRVHEMAEEFGVSHWTIRGVLQGRTWKHLVLPKLKELNDD